MKHPLGLIGQMVATAILGALGTAPSPAQEIRIRVIDVRTGNPVAGKRIRVELGLNARQENGHRTEFSAFLPRLDLKTGADGTAKLALGSPLPRDIRVFLSIGWWTECSPFIFATSDVLRAGVVAKNFCGPGIWDSKHHAVGPGDLVVFTRRNTLRERLKGFPG